MKIPFYTIDAFTSEPFSGNPAAVCPLEDDLSDKLKQNIATEMNISETCFITKERDESFKNMNDPSGRAVANVHEEAYENEEALSK